ncbi:hypothetical protein ACHAXT_010633 [Thalassiosira profunda]
MEGSDRDQPCHARSALERSLLRRQASLTPVEKSFLHSLLVDGPPPGEGGGAHAKRLEDATKVLSDDILFSVPPVQQNELEGSGIEFSSHHNPSTEGGRGGRPLPPRPTRSNEKQLDLWRAHNDGVRPKLLKQKSRRASLHNRESSGIGQEPSSDSQDVSEGRRSPRRKKSGRALMLKKVSKTGDEEDDGNSLDVLSDEEVGSINDESTASSWNSSQGGFDHYDAWEVLRDEYAGDFGFDVAVDDENAVLPCGEEEDEDENGGQRGIFKILGTSAEDVSATPHVLSPPIMDSLLNFVPDHLAFDNFWLKFSLVRDGASLDILRKYCRAATHTVLAIETTNGEVFGSFTSSPWRLNNRYFGTGESFLWRMRHGRNTPVHSLFDQAHLESEIDIYPYNGNNDYVQLCTSDKLALGGGSTARQESSIREDVVEEDLDTPPVFLENVLYGFGLALDRNLLHGTTSPSKTFGNPCLTDGSDGGETFDVMNLEVWGFTSAQTESSAQQSEMSVFFARESISNLSTSTASGTSNGSLFSADDLSRDRFYRRVGQEDENEADRDAWQYSQMMNPVAGSPYGKMGSSPYSGR